MNKLTSKFIVALFSFTLISFLGILNPSITYASHSWNGYHWARTSNPFTLKLGNNTSGTWTSLLGIASSDWSVSNVLDTTIVPGGTAPKSCRPTRGRDEICNANYGNNGWLGLAQIWVTGGTHITQGVVKANDYYFNSGSSYPYKNEAEKLHVICQEIGHTLGLDHQDESGASLNTCMDYYHNTSNTDIQSIHPNAHDYEELVSIYTHFDAITTVGQTAKSLPAPAEARGDLNDPSEWGKLVKNNNREGLYERDFGNGQKLFTFVTYAK